MSKIYKQLSAMLELKSYFIIRKDKDWVYGKWKYKVLKSTQKLFKMW